MKGGYDVYDHTKHGNYGKAFWTAAVVVGTESLTGGLGTAAEIVGGAMDFDDAYKTGTRTEYQGRGRPRNSDYNHNGYFK
jgi:hypothetical protein